MKILDSRLERCCEGLRLWRELDDRQHCFVPPATRVEQAGTIRKRHLDVDDEEVALESTSSCDKRSCLIDDH